MPGSAHRVSAEGQAMRVGRRSSACELHTPFDSRQKRAIQSFVPGIGIMATWRPGSQPGRALAPLLAMKRMGREGRRTPDHNRGLRAPANAN